MERGGGLNKGNGLWELAGEKYLWNGCDRFFFAHGVTHWRVRVPSAIPTIYLIKRRSESVTRW